MGRTLLCHPHTRARARAHTHLIVVNIFSDGQAEYTGFNSVLSLLSYLLKAPMVSRDTPVVNALFRGRACIENIFRACVGLHPQSHMLLEYKLPAPMTTKTSTTEEVKVPLKTDPRGTIRAQGRFWELGVSS